MFKIWVARTTAHNNNEDKIFRMDSKHFKYVISICSNFHQNDNHNNVALSELSLGKRPLLTRDKIDKW